MTRQNKRCIKPDCTKSAQGATGFCAAHGGGIRCKKPDCTKSNFNSQQKANVYYRNRLLYNIKTFMV